MKDEKLLYDTYDLNRLEKNMIIKYGASSYEVNARPGDRLKVYHLADSNDELFISRLRPGGCEPYLGCEAQVLADVVVSDEGVSGWMQDVAIS